MLPYYPARDGYPSMFTLYDDASAAAVKAKRWEQTVNRKAMRPMASGCQDGSNHFQIVHKSPPTTEQRRLGSSLIPKGGIEPLFDCKT